MRVAITGAAGTVGTVLRHELAEMGYQSLLLDIKQITDLRPNEDFVRADINDQPLLTQVFAGCDAIIHLAACTTDAPWPVVVDGTAGGGHGRRWLKN